jgi:tRNA A-37 threonylcarbamoyl transferase component Bud32
MTLANKTLVGQGRTAEVYAWGPGRILKLYQTWMPAVRVDEEFAIGQAAQAAGVPVPAVEARVELEGRQGIVFERVTGPTLLQHLQAKPWTLVTVARQLGELHAQIHACAALPGLPSQRQQIEAGIAAARDLPEDRQEAARRYLAQLPEGEALCHGDFHPDNIILTPRGPVIIDWLTGSRGHPLADVARSSLIMQTGGLPPRIPRLQRLAINTMRRFLHTLYLDRYLQLRPAARREIEVWLPPLIAARLREVEDYPQEKRLLEGWLEATLAKPG